MYIVGFRNEEDFERFSFPDPLPITRGLKDFIAFDTKVDEEYYYADSHPHYDILTRECSRPHTIYQMRRVNEIRMNKSSRCPTLLASMGGGGNRVPIIKTPWGVRKLTPRECFNLQGFPSTFVLPENMAKSNLYIQAGNSVVVPVIARIAEGIKTALESREPILRPVTLFD